MKPQTRRYLIDLNRRFYAHHGDAFDGTRQRPWQGWLRLPELLEPIAPIDAPTTVLDVGCGNGRFASYLQTTLTGPLSYVGVDFSDALLHRAEARRLDDTLHSARFHATDVLQDDLDGLLGGAQFHLVGCFGVLHHVPGAEERKKFLQQLLRLCRPGGWFVVSVWQLDRQPKFERKVLPWEEHLRLQPAAQEVLDLNDCEPGDHLLTWSGERLHPRYCHFPTDAEIEGWIDLLGGADVQRWQADGAGGTTNLYLAFRR